MATLKVNKLTIVDTTTQGTKGSAGSAGIDLYMRKDVIVPANKHHCDGVLVVDELSDTERGASGFGSTGE